MKAYKRIFKESSEAYKEILNQLGGNKFKVMTGSKNFAYSNEGNTLTFKLGSGAKKSITYISITLNSMDLYDIKFMDRKGKVISEFNDIYADQLTTIFTQETGFYTKL